MVGFDSSDPESVVVRQYKGPPFVPFSVTEDDARLTDFVGGDGTASDASDSSALESKDTDPVTRDRDERADEEPTESGLSTYGWGRYTCPGCGETVEHVWRDGDALVCHDCKTW